MKVYTEVIYRWDDDTNKLVEESSQSYDYEGDVDLLQETPTGPQDYTKLWEMQQEGSLSSYLEDEFGLGEKYQKYLTSFQKKPFDIMNQQYGNTLDKLQMSTGQQINTVMNETNQVASKTDFFTSGTVNQALESQKNQLLNSYTTDATSANTSLDSSIYGEQETQVNKLYSDVGNIVRLKQADSAGSSNGGRGDAKWWDLDPGNDGLCCFIMLEIEDKKGLNEDIRKFRDLNMNITNRAGYYKLAQVVVPLMRKNKLVKWFFKYLFVVPAKSWTKWHYHGKGVGKVFGPLTRTWLKLFTYLGKNHKFKIDPRSYR